MSIEVVGSVINFVALSYPSSRHIVERFEMCLQGLVVRFERSRLPSMPHPAKSLCTEVDGTCRLQILLILFNHNHIVFDEIRVTTSTNRGLFNWVEMNNAREVLSVLSTSNALNTGQARFQKHYGEQST